MSQTYECKLGESVSHTIEAENEVRHRISMTKILSEDEMKNILKDTLQKEGWEEQEDGTYQTTGEDGETLTWDLEESEVTARLEETKEVGATISVVGSGYCERSAANDAQRQIESERQRVEAKALDRQRDIEEDMAKTLEDGEEKRKHKLNDIISQVYGEAVKKKAASLGTVMSVQENNSESKYDLVIRVAG